MQPRYPILLVSVVMLLSACTTPTPAAEPDLSSGAQPTLSPAPEIAATSSPIPDSSPTPSPVPQILPTPATITAYDARLVATIDIDYPDELVSLNGYVWVKTDDGYVVQIDPATNSEVGRVYVLTASEDFRHCLGLGTDGDAIWVCSASGDEEHRTIDVVRIDPQTLSVTHTFQIDKVFDQLYMPFSDGRMWVLTDDGNKLVGIDTSSMQPDPAIELGTRCFQVAPQGDSLLLTCKLDDLLIRLDPASGQVTQQVSFDDPYTLAVTDDAVWLAAGAEIIRLDRDSLEPVAIFSGLPGGSDLFATNEAVWVRRVSGFLYRIDPAANEVVEQIVVDHPISLGGILVTDDSIWTSASEENQVIRLRLDE